MRVEGDSIAEAGKTTYTHNYFKYNTIHNLNNRHQKTIIIEITIINQHRSINKINTLFKSNIISNKNHQNISLSVFSRVPLTAGVILLTANWLQSD